MTTLLIWPVLARPQSGPIIKVPLYYAFNICLSPIDTALHENEKKNLAFSQPTQRVIMKKAVD